MTKFTISFEKNDNGSIDIKANNEGFAPCEVVGCLEIEKIRLITERLEIAHKSCEEEQNET